MQKHFILDETLQQLVVDEDGSTRIFDTREKAEEYAKANLNEYLILTS